MARAGEHLGPERAARYARKFYPWFVERLGLDPPRARALQEELQRASTLATRAGAPERRRGARTAPA